MARFRMTVVIAFMAVLCARSSAQQPACMLAIFSLSPCIGFVTGISATPSSPCCSQLATVIHPQARCLCTFLSSGAAQLVFKINQTQALTLPGACKIQIPPLIQCNAVAGAPAASPGATAASPEGAPAPAASAVPSSPSDISPSIPSPPSGQSPSTPTVPSVPNGSSSATSPSTPTTATPSGGGAKTVPTASSQSSGVGSSTPCVVVFLLLMASTISSFRDEKIY